MLSKSASVASPTHGTVAHRSRSMYVPQSCICYSMVPAILQTLGWCTITSYTRLLASADRTDDTSPRSTDLQLLYNIENRRPRSMPRLPLHPIRRCVFFPHKIVFVRGSDHVFGQAPWTSRSGNSRQTALPVASGSRIFMFSMR